MAERKHEPGVCDLYTLKERDDASRQATYEWHAAGAPEEVVKELARIVGTPGAEQ